jgi:benzoate transport
MSADPRELIARSPMGTRQVAIVAILIALNALDGFDILAISFAAPGIAAEWGIERAQLGIVLSMEMIGMFAGSLLLGAMADRQGRRPTILLCLSVMLAGMFMAANARGIVDLSVWRIITGFGIGGMLAAINAVTAEFSNERRRHLCVSLMTIGYPAGVALGGLIAARLLEHYDWRSVFYLGAAMTALAIPLVWFVVPESVHWLARRQDANALERVNAVLARIGKTAASALPAPAVQARGGTVMDIFTPGLVATTAIVSIAYFCHVMTYYYVAKWAPKLIVDMGFPSSSAAEVLVWANVGGILGGVVFGLLTLRIGVKPLTVAVMICSVLAVNAFGQAPADLQLLSLICLLVNFFTIAGISGLYAIFAAAYPTHVRAFGTGFAVGMGRGGAVLSPILAGLLLGGEGGPGFAAFVMALGSLFAAGSVVLLKLGRDGRSAAAAART